MEQIDERFFGNKNVFFPNQEWFFHQWTDRLTQMDAIFCKSQYAVDIFKPLHNNVLYTGFTSIDCYLEQIEKRAECFHATESHCPKTLI